MNPLRPVEVLQLMQAEVTQLDGGQLVVLEQRHRRLGEQHLTAVTG